MKRTNILLAATALASLTALPAHAGDVVVKYIDPDHFSDLATQRSEEDANMKTLQAHLQQLGARLPAGQVLRVDVLDVDLAGTVRHNRIGDKRVTSGLADAPHFKLRYALEANGRVIKSGEDQLTDIDYTHGNTMIGFNRGRLYYEKQLLTRWFMANFAPEAQAAR
jgi:hypothetical protein